MIPVMPDDVLDPRMVSALRDFGREPGKLLREMVQDFLVEAPSLMVDLDRAVADRAYPIVASTAHRMKGASGHMGAVRLAAIAGEIEALARAGGGDAVASATAIAHTEVELAVAAVQALHA